jgi:microcompartment protein CcmK/EutM
VSDDLVLYVQTMRSSCLSHVRLILCRLVNAKREGEELKQAGARALVTACLDEMILKVEESMWDEDRHRLATASR